MTWPRRLLVSSAAKAGNFRGQKKGSPETQHGFRSPLHWISAWSEQPLQSASLRVLEDGIQPPKRQLNSLLEKLTFRIRASL